MKKGILLSYFAIFFVFLLLILLPNWISYEHFENVSSEPSYIRKINFTVKSFLVSSPVFLMLTSFLAYLFFNHKEHYFSFMMLLFFPFKSIFEGVSLILNSKNFFKPAIASFPWKDFSDYTSYTLKVTLSASGIFILLYFFLLVLSIKKHNFKKVSE